MPLLHPDYSDYPKGWAQDALRLIAGRALHRCECSGQCGLHQGRRCCEVNKQVARWFRGRVVLSRAHTCDCYPKCANDRHIVVMCQRCHLRFDRFRHATARLETQRSPSYKTARAKHVGKSIGFENLGDLVNAPKRRRNRFWWPEPR